MKFVICPPKIQQSPIFNCIFVTVFFNVWTINFMQLFKTLLYLPSPLSLFYPAKNDCQRKMQN